MAELLGGADAVAVLAEAADVVVGVGSTLGEGDDVVGHRSDGDPTLGLAVPAQGLVAEPALAMLDSGAASRRTQTFAPGVGDDVDRRGSRLGFSKLDRGAIFGI